MKLWFATQLTNTSFGNVFNSSADGWQFTVRLRITVACYWVLNSDPETSSLLQLECLFRINLYWEINQRVGQFRCKMHNELVQSAHEGRCTNYQ